jgi:hypothetical protein
MLVGLPLLPSSALTPWTSRPPEGVAQGQLGIERAPDGAWRHDLEGLGVPVWFATRDVHPARTFGATQLRSVCLDEPIRPRRWAKSRLDTTGVTLQN